MTCDCELEQKLLKFAKHAMNTRFLYLTRQSPLLYTYKHDLPHLMRTVVDGGGRHAI